jgi:hypothetical protein
MQKDLYKLLELEPEASIQDIKKNFRKLSLKCHPDKIDKRLSQEEQNILSAKYETLSMACSVLLNPDTRREYDQLYYIEKRNEDYSSLKTHFKEFEPLPTDKTFKQLEDTLIVDRHKKLTDTYKERTLEDYQRERDYQLSQINLDKNTKCPEKQIIKKIEPEAIMPYSVSSYQEIDNVGEMYGNVESNLDCFTIDNISTDIEEHDIKNSIEDYKKATDFLKNLKDSDFQKTGSLITDNIIVRR